MRLTRRNAWRKPASNIVDVLVQSRRILQARDLLESLLWKFVTKIAIKSSRIVVCKVPRGYGSNGVYLLQSREQVLDDSIDIGPPGHFCKTGYASHRLCVSCDECCSRGSRQIAGTQLFGRVGL